MMVEVMKEGREKERKRESRRKERKKKGRKEERINGDRKGRREDERKILLISFLENLG